MSEVTKENMLFHLKHGCSFYPVCPICNAIHALIEHGPEVSREWVEQLVNLILNTGEEYVVDFAIEEFRKLGHTVKED